MTVKRIEITDTILRDAHQSLIATRMRLEDMLPALAVLDKVGYFSLEVWGGATFDVCMRYLNEDPWERLRQLKKGLPNTRLQMLLRGQNLVGYRHYADDVVDAFVEKARENGIDVFRIFDALNDIRNLVRSMHRVKQVGGLVEASISYTVSPVHTIEQFVLFARTLKDEGADLICIKDMAGMITPDESYRLISALKSEVGLPVHLHTHSASGLAPATFLRSAQAGVDIVDCALSPFSWGTSQPPTETVVSMFSEGEYETGIDRNAMYEAANHFEKVRQRYSVLLNPRSERVDTRILQHQIPGGMLSNLLSQLQMQNAGEKLNEVLEETARVRKDLGYPPLVTPTSQIVGTQAVFNVLAGERYKMVSQEVKEYVRGKYGRSPSTIDPEVRKMAIGDEKPIDGRPADSLEPELGKATQGVKEYSDRLEDALSYALFPQVATAFLKARATGTQPATTEPPPEEIKPKADSVQAEKVAQRTWAIMLGGKRYEAALESSQQVAQGRQLSLVVDGEKVELTVASAHATRQKRRSAHESADEARTVRAPMPGMIVDIRVGIGEEVAQGQVVVILEAMKMQNELKTVQAGKVKSILVSVGDSVEGRAALMELE